MKNSSGSHMLCQGCNASNVGMTNKTLGTRTEDKETAQTNGRRERTNAADTKKQTRHVSNTAQRIAHKHTNTDTQRPDKHKNKSAAPTHTHRPHISSWKRTGTFQKNTRRRRALPPVWRTCGRPSKGGAKMDSEHKQTVSTTCRQGGSV